MQCIGFIGIMGFMQVTGSIGLWASRVYRFHRVEGV